MIDDPGAYFAGLYDEFAALARSARFPEKGKPHWRNTRVFLRDDRSVVITHHSTDIIRIVPDYGIQFNTGGYYSYSTLARMKLVVSGARIRLLRYNNIVWLATPRYYSQFEDGMWVLARDGTIATSKNIPCGRLWPTLTDEQRGWCDLLQARIDYSLTPTLMRIEDLTQCSPYSGRFALVGSFHVETDHPTDKQVKSALKRVIRSRELA